MYHITVLNVMCNSFYTIDSHIYINLLKVFFLCILMFYLIRIYRNNRLKDNRENIIIIVLNLVKK